MKKLTRKITLSLVAILFAVIALGTTTYAWFTLGTTATVSSINGEVKTADGIEVSLDYNAENDNTKKNWKTSLEFKASDAYLNGTKISASTLGDVALVASKETVGELKFYNANSANYTDAGLTANVDSTYLAFDLYVKVSGDQSDKKLEATNIKIDSDVIVWTSDVTTDTLTTGKKYNLFASNAARVSFAKVDQGTVQYIDTFEGTDKTGTETDDVKNYVGGSAAGIDGNAYKYATGKGYTGAKTLFDSYETTFKSVTATNGNIQLEAKATEAEATETYLQYRVYVWLNGFDGDCINAILGSNLKVSFELSLVK